MQRGEKRIRNARKRRKAVRRALLHIDFREALLGVEPEPVRELTPLEQAEADARAHLRSILGER